MSTLKNKTKQQQRYFTDPIHGGIDVNDDLIIALIETKEFNRLARINHLGLTNFLYYSATSTRIAHSIGVYHFMYRAINQLGVNDISLSTRRALMASGLLHDIGHGPMSHVFEEVSLINHEKYTVKILEDPTTEVNKVFQKMDKQALKETVQMIEGKHKLEWCNQLISSQVDMDRLDYLLRDSSHSGVSYGLIDWRWLIRSMEIHNGKLTFQEKALPTIESILLGRYHMYKSIYHNVKNDAYSKLFLMFINRLKFLYEEKKLKGTYSPLIPIFEKREFTMGELFLLDDQVFWSLIKLTEKENDEILNLITFYLEHQKLPEIIEKDVQRFKSKQDPKLEGQTWLLSKQKSKLKFYDSEKEKEVYIIDSKKNMHELSKYSPIVKNLLNLHKDIKTNEIGIKLNNNEDTTK